MRKRQRRQKGSLRKVGKVWIAQWREQGHRRKRTLGKVSKMSKGNAEDELAKILTPINAGERVASEITTFWDFVMQVYLPFYRRKWKHSTIGANESRIRFHLMSEFSRRHLGKFNRDQLQSFLDRKAASGLSFSTVNHLRWDLRQIFNMAVAEGLLQRNPAKLLFTPSECHRPLTRYMTREEVKLLFSVLNLRETLISMLAIIAGMRPSEIFALEWKHVKDDHLDIQQGVYRGKVDSPKTPRSVRKVALSEGLQRVISKWKSFCIDTSLGAWVFPSENLKTPVSKDNCWRRHIAPNLKTIGLEWANFQVMRRTHSSLMRELNVDPKIVADQLGHSLDVNLNVYTRTGLRQRTEAVNVLESALGIS